MRSKFYRTGINVGVVLCSSKITVDILSMFSFFQWFKFAMPPIFASMVAIPMLALILLVRIPMNNYHYGKADIFAGFQNSYKSAIGYNMIRMSLDAIFTLIKSHTFARHVSEIKNIPLDAIFSIAAGSLSHFAAYPLEHKIHGQLLETAITNAKREIVSMIPATLIISILKIYLIEG